MATKSGQQEPEKAEVVEELLDALETSLDRVKVLYEQYFLGIQKQPPTFLHTDIERKIRDLAQMQIRNTALRYRNATLGQKFGSYNSYWRRTLRQIEQGTYTRNLSKIGRQAARTGADVPEEILAAMPKRMREQVRRDREAALATAKRREKPVTDGAELMTLADEDVEIDVDEFEPAAFVGESSAIRRNVLTAGGAHRIAADDDEFDVDAFFAKVTSEGDPNPLPIAPTPPSGVPVARRRTGSSGHPRPAAQSGSPAGAIPRGDRLPSAGAPLEAPAARPPVPVAAKRPSVQQASLKVAAPVASEAATTAIPRAARMVGGAPPEVAAPAEVAQTTQLPVRPTPPPMAAAEAAQTTQLPVRPTPLPVLPTPPSPAATQALPRMPVQAAASQPPAQPSAQVAPAPAVPAAAESKPAAPAAQAAATSQPAAPAAQAAATSQPAAPAAQAAAESKPAAPAAPIKPPLIAPIKAPAIGAPLRPAVLAPSQATRPLPVSPGAAARTSAQVETMSGPFPRIPSLPPVPAPNLPPVPAPRSSSGSPPPDFERAAQVAASRAVPPVPPVARAPAPAIPKIDPVKRAPAVPAAPAPPAASSPAAPAQPTTSPPSATPAAPPRPTPVSPSPAAIPPAEASAAPEHAPERPTPAPRPKAPRPPSARPAPEPRQAPPPGMSDADVNALYAKYVAAKEILGEQAGPGAYGKLLKTINAQAPKIMEQYKSKGVDFSVVVKDNQVIIRAKPKP